MKPISVHVPEHAKEYAITIGRGLIAKLGEIIDLHAYSSLIIFTDSNVEKLYLEPLTEAIEKVDPDLNLHSIVFAAGEQHKNLETVQDAYAHFASFNADRRSLMINLGGGVVTDMGGFIASTYMRGIPFINIPTTLEAMVDASVGGKTGVNFEHLKNYIGIFAQPSAVIIDVDTLKTLPKRAFLQGYAEVIKHGLIADRAYFEQVTKKLPSEYTEDELIEIITRSVSIKVAIVQEDPHEKGARKMLNFGHTIGHVIESLSLETKKPLFHGEAVAIGMVGEAYISSLLGMIKRPEFERIEAAIKDMGLPTRYETEEKIDSIVSKLKSDKKTESGSIKWSLLDGIGTGDFNIVVNHSFVRKAIEYILKK